MISSNYWKVDTISSAEIEERKSRFIAHLVPFGEFDQMLEQLRREHRKANHHVTAFRLMNSDKQIQEIGKDDGEPSGTSGMPVLKTMIGAGLMDCAVIVTRYFGGTKLGTGGLARAYSGAAKAVIEVAELKPWFLTSQVRVDVLFHLTAEVEAFVSKNGLTVVSRDYHETGTEMIVEGAEDAVLGFEAFCDALKP